MADQGYLDYTQGNHHAYTAEERSSVGDNYEGASSAGSQRALRDNDHAGALGAHDEQSGQTAAGSAAAAGPPVMGFLAARGTKYEHKPVYRTKKCMIACLTIVPITIIISLVIGLIPVLRAVAQHALKTSVLHISASNITNPTNDGFDLTLEGQVKKVGIFPAHLFFKENITVQWINPQSFQEVTLGHFAMDYIGVAAGHGRIKQQTHFYIDDQDQFGEFSKFLITQDQFTWRLRSNNVKAKAFSFISASGLAFSKDLTLAGIANFTDVGISDFQLPGNDPAGGITQAVVTRVTNPSPFGIEIGTLSVDLFYQGIYLGPAATRIPINLTTGINEIPLGGRLIPHTDQAELDVLGELFSNYLNGFSSDVIAVGKSVRLPNGEEVGWLTKGITALVLNVNLSSPTGRISPIQSITINEFDLTLTPDTAYSPSASSNTVTAGIGLPFGFSLNISEVTNTFDIANRGYIVASLAAPQGDANTMILTRNAAFTTGSLAITLPPAPLSIPDNYQNHLIYSQFQTDLALTDGAAIILNGTTSAITQTPMGQVNLKNIAFTVPAGLIGLQGLQTNTTDILGVDVIGGTDEYLILNISVGLTNPSNLNLNVGDVTFQLFADNEYLGTTLLPDLHLTIGYQEHYATGYFLANQNEMARSTLNRFANGQSTDVTIGGFNGSTTIDSLTQAFMGIQLNASLNGLPEKLLTTAALTVLTTTGGPNNVANAQVALANPFSAAIDIQTIQSNVTSRGLYLGSISAPGFSAAGKAVTTSPPLDITLNLYPPAILSLTRQLAIEAGESTEQFDGIVALGNYTYLPTTGPGSRVKRSYEATRSLEDPDLWAGYGEADYDELMRSPERLGLYLPAHATEEEEHTLEKRANIYTGFNLVEYVDRAFQQLTINVDLLSQIQIGEFTTDLQYTQEAVATKTDETLNLLLPRIAKPIVQNIVGQSVLTIDTIIIRDPTNNAFSTVLTGSITNAGPFDATISFPNGLSVAWNGRILGQIAMPDVALVGDVGASLDLTAQFAVADVEYLTEFTSYLLTSESFEWQIFGENLSIAALGIVVPEISISKSVKLNGMNGFKGLVTIDRFDLPANDAAGGISLTLQTTLQNPSSVGVDLSTISFDNFFGQTFIGPVSSTGPFTLAPRSTISLPLAGRLIPQSSAQDLAAVSAIFNGFIHGVPSDLVVQGTGAGPAGVQWLNNGIKALQIPVILPAAASLQIINSITINQVTLQFSTDDPWAPTFSTTNTSAAFQLPFAFPISINQFAGTINTVDGGNTFASLSVPSVPADTDPVARTLSLGFSNVPFNSPGSGHNTFSQFLTDVTDDESKTFGLTGSANTIASTAIGDLNINDIEFSVDTTLAGLQGLNSRPATVANLDVFHGYTNYLQINVDATLYNPSQITIGIGDVDFDLDFNGQKIGTAHIPGLVLTPGVNVIPTQVRYAPSGGDATAAGQLLLENFIQAIASTTIIAGTREATSINSLKQALASIQLSTTIPPLEQNLITQAALTFPTNIASTGIASATFNLANPFTAAINLRGVDTTAVYLTGSETLNLGRINVPNLDPVIHAPGHTAITSPALPFEFNLDPKTIIKLLEAQASKNSVPLGPLVPYFDYVLGLESTETNITSTALPGPESPAGCNNGTQFDVFGAVLDSLENLNVNLQISSDLALDDYATSLNFVQNNIPAVTDSTALYLIGVVAPVIVQSIVSSATLSFSTVNIYDITAQGFQTDLNGALLNAGPFNALITFPKGIDVNFVNQNLNDIANIMLPPLCNAANIGAPNLETSGKLTITNEGRFEEFAKFIVNNPSWTWEVHTDQLAVEALGTTFEGVSISKNLDFLAFNGLPGTTVSDLDVAYGYPTYLQINLNAHIYNPSNITIAFGGVTFNLDFQGQQIGTVVIDSLSLVPGANVVPSAVHYEPKGDAAVAAGQILLENYVQAVVSTAQIMGSRDSSDIPWLGAAFSVLELETDIPPYTQNLITRANLVFRRDVADSGLADATFTLANPFNASVNINGVYAQAIYPLQGGDLNLGNITQPNLPTPISFPGHTEMTSYALPFNFNLDPKTIIRLLAVQAQKNGVELGPLIPYFQTVLALNSTETRITAEPQDGASTPSPPGCDSAEQFDVFGAILNSLANLAVTLEIDSSVHLDYYPTKLNFNQFNVPAITDSTALYLIGAVAPTIVQAIVEAATLQFNTVRIYDVTAQGFQTDLTGSLENAGPFNALISFPKGIRVDFVNEQLTDIASIELPPLCSAATISLPDYRTSGKLTISNEGKFEDFAKFIVNNPAWQWVVHTDELQVQALGIIFNHVSISKELNFLAFNGLPGTTVSDLDVNHGYPDYLQINLNAHIFNPSNISIEFGDVTFDLDFMGEKIGTVVITPLSLVPLNNTIPSAVRFAPSGAASVAAGKVLLQNYVQNVTSTTQILGSRDSSDIPWLGAAFSVLELQTDIPPYAGNLITQAALSFQIDIGTNGGIAQANFNLSNPFTASINIKGIQADATYRFNPNLNLTLGNISQPSVDPVISAPGHTMIQSRNLPFNFNLDPKIIIELLAAQAAKNRVPLGPLQELFQYVLSLPSTDSPIKATVEPGSPPSPPGCTSGDQFDVFGTILAALKNLIIDLNIASSLALDEYNTELDFNQYNIPAVVDDTALYLIGVVAPTIVQRLVDGAVLTVTQANVTNVTDAGFTAALAGSLLNTGPFNALIGFPEGLIVNYKGKDIAKLALPDICSPATVAVPDLQIAGNILTITDEGAFEDFATDILQNESFEWTLHSDKLRVSALGIIFDDVSISKNITLQAFNGLPGVTLSDFDLPRDDPDGQSIDLTVDSLIPSQATLGIELGTVHFNAFFNGNLVGPVSGDNLFLAAQSITTAPLYGRIVHQNTSEQLDSTGVLFSQFLQGNNLTLQVKGVDVISPAQPDRPVRWLTPGFQQLTLNVILPGKKYDNIISAIQIEDLSLELLNQNEAYNLPSSSNKTQATFANPFGFGLGVKATAVNIEVVYQGIDVGTLTLPTQDVVTSGKSTGPNDPSTLVLSFQKIPLISTNNAQFQVFFRDVTNEAQVAFNLTGGADVTTDTVIGNIVITGIPFNVVSTLVGINSFGHQLDIPMTPRTLGSGSNSNPFANVSGTDFIRITLDVVLNNPSQISLLTDQVSLQVFYSNVYVGRAYVNPLNLVPGTSSYFSEFHYMPVNPADPAAQDLLTQYLMAPNKKVPLHITGAPVEGANGMGPSSPYGSIQPALAPVSIDGPFANAATELVTSITIFLDLAEALCENKSSIEFTVDNPLDSDIVFATLDAETVQGGTVFGTVSHTFSPVFVAPAHGSATSDRIENVTLTQGGFGSLGLLIPPYRFDLITTVAGQVRNPGAADGYSFPSLKYNQSGVSYTFHPTVGGVPLSLDILGDLVGIITELGDIIECIGDKIFAPAGTAIESALAPLFSLGKEVCAVGYTLIGDVCRALTSKISGLFATVTEVIDPQTSIAQITSVVAGAQTVFTSEVPAIVSTVTSLIGGIENVVPVTIPASVVTITSALPAQTQVVTQTVVGGASTVVATTTVDGIVSYTPTTYVTGGSTVTDLVPVTTILATPTLAKRALPDAMPTAPPQQDYVRAEAEERETRERAWALHKAAHKKRQEEKIWEYLRKRGYPVEMHGK